MAAMVPADDAVDDAPPPAGAVDVLALLRDENRERIPFSSASSSSPGMFIDVMLFAPREIKKNRSEERGKRERRRGEKKSGRDGALLQYKVNSNGARLCHACTKDRTLGLSKPRVVSRPHQYQYHDASR